MPKAYVEYIPVDPSIYKGLTHILELGTGTTDVALGLAERAKAIRVFIDVWDGKVSDGFSRLLAKIRSHVDVKTEGVPSLPDPRGYDIATPEGFKKLWDDVKKAWNAQKQWFDAFHNQEKDSNTIMPIDRFMQMTSDIRHAMEIVAPITIKVVDRGVRSYRFTDTGAWHGHMICEVDEDGDISWFKEMEKQTESVPANMAKFKVHASLPKGISAAQAKSVTYDKTKLLKLSRKELKDVARAIVPPTVFKEVWNSQAMIGAILKYQEKPDDIKEPEKPVQAGSPEPQPGAFDAESGRGDTESGEKAGEKAGGS